MVLFVDYICFVIRRVGDFLFLDFRFVGFLDFWIFGFPCLAILVHETQSPYDLQSYRTKCNRGSSLRTGSAYVGSSAV